MCDCYSHKCKECDTKLPVHLGDYETERDEIEVFCQNHLPDKDVRIFTLTKKFEFPDRYPDDYEPNVGWQMGIRALTDNARKWKEYNHPNLASDVEVKDL